jgi:hypothetical protein
LKRKLLVIFVRDQTEKIAKTEKTFTGIRPFYTYGAIASIQTLIMCLAEAVVLVRKLSQLFNAQLS